MSTTNQQQTAVNLIICHRKCPLSEHPFQHHSSMLTISNTPWRQPGNDPHTPHAATAQASRGRNTAVGFHWWAPASTPRGSKRRAGAYRTQQPHHRTHVTCICIYKHTPRHTYIYTKLFKSCCRHISSLQLAEAPRRPRNQFHTVGGVGAGVACLAPPPPYPHPPVIIKT